MFYLLGMNKYPKHEIDKRNAAINAGPEINSLLPN